MKMCKKGVVAALLTLTLWFGMGVESVAAAEVKGASVNVKISLDGTLPQVAEDYVVQLTAEDKDAPMPEESKDGVYVMTITGAGEKALPEITYRKLGVYKYRIAQIAGQNADCTYDDSVYHLTVSVTNSETEEGAYEVTCALYKDQESEKLDNAVFENHYVVVTPTPTPTPTPAPAPVVKTGDTNPTGLYMMILILSAAVIIGVAAARRKKC